MMRHYFSLMLNDAEWWWMMQIVLFECCCWKFDRFLWKASWSLAVCVLLEIDAILFVLFSGPHDLLCKACYCLAPLIIFIRRSAILISDISFNITGCLVFMVYYAKTSYNIFIIHNSNIFTKEQKWLQGLNLESFLNENYQIFLQL